MNLDMYAFNGDEVHLARANVCALLALESTINGSTEELGNQVAMLGHQIESAALDLKGSD